MSDKQYTHQDRTHLENVLRRARPWFEANATFLIYGVAAILAVAAAVVWYQRQLPDNAIVSADWMVARQPEDFQAIADSHESTGLGQRARLRQATELLNSGIRNQFINRSAARDELDQAESAFRRLANTSSLNSEIHERVLIGIAKLTETRCDGSDESIKAGIDAWEHVLDEYENSIAREHARQRIARLSQESAREFYAWFHGLDPKPTDDLSVPGLPDMDVPDVPDLSLIPGMPELPDLPEMGLIESGGSGSEASDDGADAETESGHSQESPTTATDAVSDEPPAADSEDSAASESSDEDEDRSRSKSPSEEDGGDKSEEASTGDEPVEEAPSDVPVPDPGE